MYFLCMTLPLTISTLPYTPLPSTTLFRSPAAGRSPHLKRRRKPLFLGCGQESRGSVRPVRQAPQVTNARTSIASIAQRPLRAPLRRREPLLQAEFGDPVDRGLEQRPRHRHAVRLERHPAQDLLLVDRKSTRLNSSH